jgi:threonine efflux protein
MSYALTLAGIGAVHLVAAVSPGPGFVTATRVSVAQPRGVALAAAIGLAMAAILWACAASIGMHTLLVEAAALYRWLQLVGGAYLVWLGIAAWRHAGDPAPDPVTALSAMRGWEAFRLGLATNLANPKVVVFFGSIFVTLFTPETPGWVRLAALAIVAVNEISWYVLLATLFSSRVAQAAYRRAKATVDRLTGCVMIAFGAKLVLSARQ